MDTPSESTAENSKNGAADPAPFFAVLVIRCCSDDGFFFAGFPTIDFIQRIRYNNTQ